MCVHIPHTYGASNSQECCVRRPPKVTVCWPAHACPAVRFESLGSSLTLYQQSDEVKETTPQCESDQVPPGSEEHSPCTCQYSNKNIYNLHFNRSASRAIVKCSQMLSGWIYGACIFRFKNRIQFFWNHTLVTVTWILFPVCSPSTWVEPGALTITLDKHHWTTVPTLFFLPFLRQCH